GERDGMVHAAPLITTIVSGLVLAFVLGALADRFRISPLVGYLLAGVLVGPFTPGFVADQGLARQLAEIGVILLMFGVGLHFSLKDLLAVRWIAIPGAAIQILLITPMGMALAWLLGWSAGAGLVFGLSLAVASTVVVLRVLEQKRLVDGDAGRIAIGWLIVEDVAMVIALVLLPVSIGLLKTEGAASAALLPLSEMLLPLGITLAKIAAFVGIMLLIGRRIIPWILHHIAHTGSRELFRLAILAIALGVAYGSAELFGVSFALGAFFAGMILSESELSQQAAAESLPLRDAFAVLFFVSVGMLFDPWILVDDPWAVVATVLIIVVAKPAMAVAIGVAFRLPAEVTLIIAGTRAQIGEFSFILAGLGLSLGLLPEHGRDLVLAGAMLSILVNPIFFAVTARLRPRFERPAAIEDGPPDRAPALTVSALEDHTVVIGSGRVGSLLGEALRQAGRTFLVIEDRRERIEQLREEGIETIIGNAASPEVLAAANLGKARQLFIAIPNGFEAGQIAEQARALNPSLEIVARAHSDAEVEHLDSHGADLVIMGEREIARAMIERALDAALPAADRERALPRMESA
ncbi:MAG: YbaL family putative K(+) efflux transporter, partial [Dongiaceae bacterium]